MCGPRDSPHADREGFGLGCAATLAFFTARFAATALSNDHPNPVAAYLLSGPPQAPPDQAAILCFNSSSGTIWSRIEEPETVRLQPETGDVPCFSNHVLRCRRSYTSSSPDIRTGSAIRDPLRRQRYSRGVSAEPGDSFDSSTVTGSSRSLMNWSLHFPRMGLVAESSGSKWFDEHVAEARARQTFVKYSLQNRQSSRTGW